MCVWCWLGNGSERNTGEMRTRMAQTKNKVGGLASDSEPLVYSAPVTVGARGSVCAEQRSHNLWARPLGVPLQNFTY